MASVSVFDKLDQFMDQLEEFKRNMSIMNIDMHLFEIMDIPAEDMELAQGTQKYGAKSSSQTRQYIDHCLLHGVQVFTIRKSNTEPGPDGHVLATIVKGVQTKDSSFVAHLEHKILV